MVRHARHGNVQQGVEMYIRLATPADLVRISTCAHDAYAPYVERIGRKPAPMVADFRRQIDEEKIFVAADPSDVQGFAVFYPAGRFMHLENVAVDPRYKGQGIGRALIDFVESAARDQRLAGVELYTNAHMTENLEMYPKLGYVEVDRRTEAGFSRVFFRKSL